MIYDQADSSHAWDLEKIAHHALLFVRKLQKNVHQFQNTDEGNSF